jgi:hypothetical protein
MQTHMQRSIDFVQSSSALHATLPLSFKQTNETKDTKESTTYRQMCGRSTWFPWREITASSLPSRPSEKTMATVALFCFLFFPSWYR